MRRPFNWRDYHRLDAIASATLYRRLAVESYHRGEIERARDNIRLAQSCHDVARAAKEIPADYSGGLCHGYERTEAGRQMRFTGWPGSTPLGPMWNPTSDEWRDHLAGRLR
jgi:hypothetical protein